MKVKKAYTGLAVVVFLICIFEMSVEYIGKKQVQKIKEHGKRTEAYVLSVEMHKKPTLPWIQYFYIANYDTISSSYFVESGASFSKLKSLEKATIPLIYDSTNVKKHILQINESAYQ